MKPRTDNILMNLPEENRHQLNEWLLNHSYPEVKTILAKDPPDGLGIETSTSALGRYYREKIPDHLIDRRDENVQSSTEAAAAIAGQPAPFDIPNLDFLKQRFWKLITASESPVLDIARLYRLILKTKDQEFARERFEYNVAEIALKHASALRDIAQHPTMETKEKRRAARLELFGVLTDQEEPITHTAYNPAIQASANLAATAETANPASSL